MSGTVIASSVFEAPATLREQFANATPFRHVVIDGFFASAHADELLATFPHPDRSLHINPFGAPGLKAYRRNLIELGPAYAATQAALSSTAFLEWLTEVTEVAGLLYDPEHAGGGTHENFNGRDLRPHVDFNVHPATRWHRRLNLIVYLNEKWDTSWGGTLTLYRDPRDPAAHTTSYAPLFNRCVLFETTEHSWHGFDRIALPAVESGRTRKSLSLFFYTQSPPIDAAEHTTFFVPRRLPSRYVDGYTLTDDDARERGELIGQRDRLIDLYQSKLRERDQ